MSKLSMRDMIKAGVHFGHLSRYWNPKMKPYIFTKKQKVHIINLEKTIPMLSKAMDYIADIVLKQGIILFVGTKRAAKQILKEEAIRAGMPYINHRWLGGMLTNYKTIRKSIRHLKELDQMEIDGLFDKMLKKEALKIRRVHQKLQRSFSGIKNMNGLPDALFVIDSKHENIAIKEAKRLNIPVIGIVDTNSDPDYVDYLIPGNDDATRAIRIYLNNIADIIIQTKEISHPLKENKKIFTNPIIKEKKNIFLKKQNKKILDIKK